MSIFKEVCGGPEPKWKSDESIHKLPEAKLITSLECIQLKRELESESQDEFEVSPMILCLMLTFLLFLIGFWIWLISRSCLFSQPEQVKKNTMDEGRTSGGSTPRYKSHKVRCFDEVADWDDHPFNYSGSKQGLETEYESSQRAKESLPGTDEKETDISTSQALAGSPLFLCSPKRKYRIKWSKFIGRNQKDQSKTESPE